ncbi:hypothetical protein G039_0319440 [Pseudomonas aeruginosa VRFPA01]|nr:hypothetical protein G039_0319440 [Pseudomonas aeruginosa VRFPA01]
MDERLHRAVDDEVLQPPQATRNSGARAFHGLVGESAGEPGDWVLRRYEVLRVHLSVAVTRSFQVLDLLLSRHFEQGGSLSHSRFITSSNPQVSHL